MGITGLGKYFKFTGPEEVENDDAKNNEQHHHGDGEVEFKEEEYKEEEESKEEEDSKQDDSAAEAAFYRLNIRVGDRLAVPWIYRRECLYCLTANKENITWPRSFGKMDQRCPCIYEGYFNILPAEMEQRTYACPGCKGSGTKQKAGHISTILNQVNAYLPLPSCTTGWYRYPCDMCHGKTTIEMQCKWPEWKRWRRLMTTTSCGMLSELC